MLQNLDLRDVIQKHYLFLPNKMMWNINLPTSARVPSKLLVSLITRIFWLAFSMRLSKGSLKKMFYEKNVLYRLKKSKLFNKYTHPSYVRRKKYTPLSTFKVLIHTLWKKSTTFYRSFLSIFVDILSKNILNIKTKYFFCQMTWFSHIVSHS